MAILEADISSFSNAGAADSLTPMAQGILDISEAAASTIQDGVNDSLDAGTDSHGNWNFSKMIGLQNITLTVYDDPILNPALII